MKNVSVAWIITTNTKAIASLKQSPAVRDKSRSTTTVSTILPIASMWMMRVSAIDVKVMTTLSLLVWEEHIGI